MLIPSLKEMSQPKIKKVNGSFCQQARTTLTRTERHQKLRRRIECMARPTILTEPFFQADYRFSYFAMLERGELLNQRGAAL